jgi:20S proteasome subunit alpha 5
MYQNRAEYDRGVNTFSPEGRLFQVEYAIEAIKLGSTAIGIRARDGVVLAVEKRLTSPLIVPSSVEKIFELDSHIGCAVSGLTADARMLVEHARVECQNHRFVYNEPLKTESLTQAVCDLALRFGENGASERAILSRPFGVALLIAGFDESGPHLFFADPSGTFMEYSAKAIGSASEVAQTQLQEEFRRDLSLNEAEILAVKILKQVMEDSIDSTNAQVALLTKESGFKIYSEQDLAALLARIPSAAQVSMDS